jgi:NADH:ubiquinone oxidoreductase subunit 3 (subunit A)
MENYFPILMFVLVGIAVGVLPVAMGFILAPSRPDPEKLSPYECGFEAFEDARMKFDVRYYLIAILFILFDLEIAFLFPVGDNFQGYRCDRFDKAVRLCRNADLRCHSAHWLCVCLGQGGAGMGMRLDHGY